MSPDNLSYARDLVAGARRIVAFTGAGVSAESGIPTFRGHGGIWARVPVEDFGTPWGVRDMARDRPAELAQHLVEVGGVLLSAQPNPAHHAIGAWQRAGKALGVVTQNVDDLHELGGSDLVHKLHGDLFRWRCTQCGAVVPLGREELQGLVDRLRGLTTEAALKSALPECGCGAMLRPDVVLYGEMLPEPTVQAAGELLGQADLIVIVGTSGLVEPAAGLARDAMRRGTRSIEVNLEPSAWTADVDAALHGPAGEILPRLG